MILALAWATVKDPALTSSLNPRHCLRNPLPVLCVSGTKPWRPAPLIVTAKAPALMALR
jgi:hypothetical protein